MKKPTAANHNPHHKSKLAEKSTTPGASNYTADALLLERLQLLSEKEFTTEVVIPLLKALGYGRVDYSGGPAEQGKDLICWREDDLGDPELTVVQIKRYKPAKKAADSRSFSEIVTQLSQAIEKPLPNVDGQSYLPSLVYFVSPYPLDTPTLQTRFEAIASLRPRRVKIMDGPRIIAILKKNLPHIINQLCGLQVNVRGVVGAQLTNWDLLSALDARTRRPVDTFFTDIDFCLGKQSTRFFFLSTPSPTIITEKIMPEDWIQLKSLSHLATRELEIQLLAIPEEEIDKLFARQSHLTESWQSKISQLRERIEKLEKSVVELKRTATRKREELYRSFPELSRLHERVDKLADELRNLHEQGERSGTRDLALEEEVAIKQRMEKILSQLDKEDKILRPVQQLLLSLEGDIYRLRREEASLQKIRPAPNVDIGLDGNPLADVLASKRRWVDEHVKQFSSTTPSIPDIRNFLLECKRLFDVTGELLGHKLISQAAGIKHTSTYSIEAAKSRLEMPIHAAFETGINIVVLGEAGAGKTTSLQMYAFHHLANSEHLVIYAPLGRLVRVWGQRRGRSEAGFLAPPLEEGLSLFLSSLGAPISSSELTSELASRKAAILLDGIDEAIRFAPWIIESMVRFSENYPQVQVITSSRIAGRYIEDIPFLAISLLPFTPVQRQRFVSKWFANSKKHIRRIEHHLTSNPAIGEVIKTPLLATILCVLEENEVPLPNSEVRLYEERMRLLLGDYDIHKQTTRLSSKRYHLEHAARKIAFRLHVANKREEDREQLYVLSEKALHKELRQEHTRLVVDELVDPCNILVPMSEDGKLGFGHLAYQEYLVAKEIMHNRAINLLSIISNPWWRGPLVLFSRLADDIEWLLKRLSVTGISQTGARETIISMIKARPQEEHSALKEIFERSLEWAIKDDQHEYDYLFEDEDFGYPEDDFEAPSYE